MQAPGSTGSDSSWKPLAGHNTIAEIAERVGVSSSLVSAFLSGRDYRANGKSGIRVARKTGEKIRDVCRQMGYWPEKAVAFNRIYPELAETCIIAQGVGLQKSRYASLILHGILDAAEEIGTKISVSYYDPDLDYRKHPEKLPLTVVDPAVRKFILTSLPNRSLIDALLSRGKHIVYVTRDVSIPGVATVVPDYGQAASQAMRYLFNTGHRRIGFVAHSYFKDSLYSVKLREGIREAENSLGLSFDDEDLYPENNSIQDTLKRLFTKPDPPTAIFAFDDLSAEDAIAILKEMRYAVPHDVSVVGCNDELESARHDPPLTTVHLPIMEIGIRAVKLLNQLMIAQPDEDLEQHVVLPVYLVERASSRRIFS